MIATDHAEAALSLDEARARLDAAIEPVVAVEAIALRHAVGRVLARPLAAPVDVPAHDNAAMDGYAVRTADLDGSLPVTLPVVGRAAAGAPFGGTVPPGACVRILTGAVMPVGCDAVVPQEEVVVAGDAIVLSTTPRAGQHRRLAGEDLRAGAMVLPAGRRLTPADLGLAASTGAPTLPVVRRLRVAVFSTGDELRDLDVAAGGPLDAGAVRDSNRYTLIGMLSRLGVEIVDLGIVRDDPDALRATIVAACDAAVDAIVTSGGVSAGDADHTRAVLAEVGRVDFWKLAIRPGRPMAFGRVRCGERGAWLFALPGNPVAVMVVFYALVRPALWRLAGADVPAPTAFRAVCDAALPKSPGRTEFVRGITATRDGAVHVRPTGAQGSGILRSMSEANCLIVLEPSRGPVAVGETVEVWPFDGLV